MFIRKETNQYFKLLRKTEEWKNKFDFTLSFSHL